MSNIEEYNEADIRILSLAEHIRMHPYMYIQQFGDGTSCNDGIYVLLNEVIQNSVDEHMLGFGNKIFYRSNDTAVINFHTVPGWECV